MNKTGLFFGTFNPIHYGHLIIAQYFLDHNGLDKICFVVSPHNPLKNYTDLIKPNSRLEMTQLAISDNPDFEVSDIEFHLPQPSFTSQTMKKLSEDFPEKEYVILMGSDSIESIEKWKDFQYLLEDFEIYVYPRSGHPKTSMNFPHFRISYFNAPLVDISATLIRNNLQSGKSIRYLSPPAVCEYLAKRIGW